MNLNVLKYSYSQLSYHVLKVKFTYSSFKAFQHVTEISLEVICSKAYDMQNLSHIEATLQSPKGETFRDECTIVRTHMCCVYKNFRTSPRTSPHWVQWLPPCSKFMNKWTQQPTWQTVLVNRTLEFYDSLTGLHLCMSNRIVGAIGFGIEIS